MKYILSFFQLLLFNFCFSQGVVSTPNQYESTWRLKQIIRNTLNTQSRDNPINFKDIKGSPYDNEEFQIGEIIIDNKSLGKYFLRIDTYNDEVQILKNDSDLKNPSYDILLNLENLKLIISDTTFVRIDYINENKEKASGFFTPLLDSDTYGLYTKKRTLLTPATKAASPNQGGRAAKFTTYEDFYLRLQDSKEPLILIPKKKKKFLELIENYENTKQIRAYLKEENLKVSNKEDVITLFEYLNQL